MHQINCVTRAAPTVSGSLHLGSLYNAMLNWLYARKNSGTYNVRLDGHLIRGTRCDDRDNILKDLELFGLQGDNLIRQEDRLSEHIVAFKELVKDNPDSFYECDCTINDIARRSLFPPHRHSYKLIRKEKYPRPCKLQKLEILNTENKDVALNQNIHASHEARFNKADVLINGKDDYSNFWVNTDLGNMKSPDMTSLVVQMDKLQNVCSVQLTFRDFPFLDYQIFVFYEDKWQAVARVNKPVEYFIEPRPALQYPVGFTERINFAPILTNAIKVDITRLPLPLDRPYHYDYHCKNLNKKLNWADIKTVVRCHYNQEVYMNYLEFITEERIPNSQLEIDTAAWFDGKPDLVFSSPYDDKAMGATHIIRGEDIYSFFWMEVMLTRLLNYKPVYHYHPMVLDEKGVKYSKFIKSTRISDYLTDKVTPGKIIGYLAWKGWLVDEYPGEISMHELVKDFDLSRIGKEPIVIDDKEMMLFLSEL